MASNKSNGSRSYISADMDIETDARPEHSPYASETCTVLFGDWKKLHIPSDLLSQVPQIDRYLDARCRLQGHFKDITSETGHVLFHFLVCGVYQPLRPQGDSLEERHVSEFKTALNVYVAADSLQVPRLRDLARREITRVGDSLSLPSIISAIEDSGLSFKTLPGVTAYVESRILSFGENATPAAINSMLSELGGANTLSRTLLKSMVLLKSSELSKQHQKLHANEGRIFSGAAVSVLDNEMRMRRMSPTEQAMKEAEAKAEAMLEEKMLPLAEKACYREEEAHPSDEAVVDEVPAEEVSAEEAVCQVQASPDDKEIHDLLAKKAKRGKLLTRETKRLYLLLERSWVDPAQAKAAEVVAPLGEATAALPVALPVMDERPSLDVPRSLNVEAGYVEVVSADRPGSRSSETWSFAATPDSPSSQTSPKLEASTVQAEEKEEDFWDALLARRPKLATSRG